MVKKTALSTVFCLLMATAAAAQSTTGTISGRVVDTQGLPVPGVTVTATSPNLQGQRQTVTSENGDYILTLLPPGTYTLTYELSGFETQKTSVTVAGPGWPGVTVSSDEKPCANRSSENGKPGGTPSVWLASPF